MSERVCYIDAPAGLSGDMFLGALIDAGLSPDVLTALPARLGLPHVEVRITKTERAAFAATKVDVLVNDKHVTPAIDVHQRAFDSHDGHDHDHGHNHVHRTLADVLHILSHAGSLEIGPLATAARAFRLLAEAEAAVHGTDVERVHFHEVGAADAIVDIAGTCIGFAELGVSRLAVSPLPWGTGTVHGAHGEMPIPAPATVRLLTGLATFPSGETYEQVTPTGAALVRALVTDEALPNDFCPEHVGMGAGHHPGGRLANVLRLVIGTVATIRKPEAGEALLLETNLDDCTGEQMGYVIERALALGALDAWATPSTMKKGRPGVVLSVLTNRAHRETLEALLFEETTTLGIRASTVTRSTLPRRLQQVMTPWGLVQVKVRTLPSGEERASPEYEDCATIAHTHGVALRDVMDAAMLAYREVATSTSNES